MNVDRSFDWLGRFPLAVDVADTVRLVRGREVELLVDEDSLSRWIEAELSRFPVAKAASGHLAEILPLRDAVRGVLKAHSADQTLPQQALEVLNAASARSPSYPTIDQARHTEIVEMSDESFDVFQAQIARSTFEMLEKEAAALSVCEAPSCGMFFVPGNRKQRWCSPRCGNRARVARHAARDGL